MVAADPADDPPPKGPTPSQVMDKLLLDARNAKRDKE
jgi:hypothetical protein